MIVEVYPKVVPLDGTTWTARNTRTVVRAARKESDALGWTVIDVYQKERDTSPKVVVTFDVPDGTTLDDIWAWADTVIASIRKASDGTAFGWKVCVGGDIVGRVEGVYP